MVTLEEILKAYQTYIHTRDTGFRLARNNVGLEPIFDPNVSTGGIHIPEQAKGRCTQGIVKYKGPEVVDLNIGDYCIFSGYNGDLIAFGDELIITMPEDMIAAVIVDNEFINLGDPIYTRNELVKLIKNQSKNYLGVRPVFSDADSRDKPV